MHLVLFLVAFHHKLLILVIAQLLVLVQVSTSTTAPKAERSAGFAKSQWKTDENSVAEPSTLENALNLLVSELHFHLLHDLAKDLQKVRSCQIQSISRDHRRHIHSHED